MKIKRVTCNKTQLGLPAVHHQLGTNELSVEEFANLRMLVDRTGLLDRANMPPSHEDDDDTLMLQIDTVSGLYTYHFNQKDISDEVNELAEFINEKSKHIEESSAA